MPEGVQAHVLERVDDIEYEDVVGVVCGAPGYVLCPECFRPGFDEGTNLLLGGQVHTLVNHVLKYCRRRVNSQVST